DHDEVGGAGAGQSAQQRRIEDSMITQQQPAPPQSWVFGRRVGGGVGRAPARVTASAPGASPAATAPARSASVASATASAPTKASPAPTVSTTFTTGAGQWPASPAGSAYTAPSAPRVTITVPSMWDAAAAACSGVRTAVPKTAWASVSLTTSTSI